MHYHYPVDKTKTKDMDKNILKTVIADNQIEIPRYFIAGEYGSRKFAA